MVEAAERDGVLTPDSVLIESSSGNLGVALAMIAASRGYRFLCVTDPRCNLSTRRLMEALGSQVHTVTEPDPVGGFLGARIDYVEAMCASDPRFVWLNQYRNPGNWRAHFKRTGPAIARDFPDRSEDHTSELQSRQSLVCRLLLEKKKKSTTPTCSGASTHA